MKNFDAPTRSSVPGFTAIHDSEWLELSGWGPQVPGTYAGFAGYPPPITGLLATTFVNATELDQSRPAAAPADDACRTRVIARMTAPTRAFTEDRDMADLPIFASFRPRPPTRDASPESLERAYRQKEAILLDRGARTMKRTTPLTGALIVASGSPTRSTSSPTTSPAATCWSTRTRV